MAFGGLPGQARQGWVWDFDVVVSGPFKNLMREGVTLKPQGDLEASSTHGQKPKEKTHKMKLGPYISPEFERTPEGKGIVDTCRYTIVARGRSVVVRLRIEEQDRQLQVALRGPLRGDIGHEDPIHGEVDTLGWWRPCCEDRVVF